MNMIRKGQFDGLNRIALLECKFINELFGITDDPKAVIVNSQNKILNNFYHMNLLQFTVI